MNSARSHSDSSLSVPLHCTPFSTIGRTTPSGNVGRGEKKLPRTSGPTTNQMCASHCGIIVRDLFRKTYVLGNCCWFQTTSASALSNVDAELQTVPQRSPTQYSSRPSLELSSPARRTSVDLHSAASSNTAITVSVSIICFSSQIQCGQAVQINKHS